MEKRKSILVKRAEDAKAKAEEVAEDAKAEKDDGDDPESVEVKTSSSVTRRKSLLLAKEETSERPEVIRPPDSDEEFDFDDI